MAATSERNGDGHDEKGCAVFHYSLTLTSPVVKNYLLRPQRSLRRRRWMRAQRHDQGDRVDEDRGQERELIEGQGKTRRRVLL